MPIGFVYTWWYHVNSVGSKLYYHSNGFRGPLIHHLEVSKQGFVLAVLPFGKIQTRLSISWLTIQNHNSEWFQMVRQLVWKRYQK